LNPRPYPPQPILSKEREMPFELELIGTLFASFSFLFFNWSQNYVFACFQYQVIKTEINIRIKKTTKISQEMGLKRGN
jgi:hypothetical protein